MKLRLFIGCVLALGWLPLASVSLHAQTATENPTWIQKLRTVTLHIGPVTLATEVASTNAEMEQGLMYRTKMGDNEGMIFLLGHVGPAAFWMKNTLIPLSVAFIDSNGVLLEIHDMKPQDETITRSDSKLIAYALETNLHWFSLNGVKPGDKIDPPPATLGKKDSP
jgi:uncharacterized membrane protein (UPF0127 family)